MGKIKKLFKRLLFMIIFYYIYITCWGFLFVYVENCLPGKEPYKMSEDEIEFTNHIAKIDDLSDNEKQKFINISMEYHQSITRNTRSCDYGLSNVMEWCIFAIVSCTTVGEYTVFVTITINVLLIIQLTTLNLNAFVQNINALIFPSNNTTISI